MSVQATSWVWDKAHVNGHELLVLLAIADSCNREGEGACQSISTLSAMARISERTCYRIVASLRDEGWIEKTGVNGRYNTNVYRLAQMQIGPITAPSEPDVTPVTPDTCQVVTPDKSGDRPLSPVADEPTTTPVTTQVIPSTEVAKEQTMVAPTLHGARAISHDWAPSREQIEMLRGLYPRVNLRESCRRFVAFHLSRQDTSRSWEAAFLAWASQDEQRIIDQTKGGTDDLGRPHTQRSTSSVSDAAQPGDDDYVDPEELHRLALEAAERSKRTP